jgi:hypothetical protein
MRDVKISSTIVYTMMLHDASAAKPTLTYNDASIDKEIKVT